METKISYHGGSVCTIKGLIITKQNQEIEGIEANDDEGKDSKRVKYLSLSGIVFFVPIKIEKQFNNLMVLSIINCGLTEISRNNLKPFIHLRELQLYGNRIQALSHNLFEHSLLLDVLSFENNQIKYISVHTLKPLKNLKIANFLGNVNINMCFLKSSYEVSLEALQEEIARSCKRNCESTKEISTVSSYMSKVWETGLLSDFTIKAGSVSFKVHKNILAANSPVFAAMFSHNMQENRESMMSIDDFSPESIKDFLEFIYLRKAPSESTNAIDLYRISAEYQLDELTAIAEPLVIDSLSSENAFEIYMLGNLHNSDLMKMLAFAEVEIGLKMKLPTELIDNSTAFEKIVTANQEMEKELERAHQKRQKVFDEVIVSLKNK